MSPKKNFQDNAVAESFFFKEVFCSPSARVRRTYGTPFRAPALYELYLVGRPCCRSSRI